MIYSVITLGAIGTTAAVVLYLVAQKFKVIEDPRIDLVNDALPAANCGGCGYAGCRNFAESIVKAGSLEGFNCPAGGAAVMKAVGAILGLEAQIAEPMIAVIRCNGNRTNAPARVTLDGTDTCAFAHMTFAGESGCPSGCLGIGDCVKACAFDAIYMDESTGLPIVKDNCVACGVCVKACPRGIIELRQKGKKDRRIFVSCINQEKGALAKKNCQVACIACGKCVKICPFEAITMANNLAYIDYTKCKLCRKCVPECPTGAILEFNFPPRKADTPEVASEAIA